MRTIPVGRDIRVGNPFPVMPVAVKAFELLCAGPVNILECPMLAALFFDHDFAVFLEY
jgi:hypothetical protein